jgi:DNA-directed RNA polymerase specialized sigma24 family protein
MVNSMASPDEPQGAGVGRRDFVTTHWSVVLLACDSQSPGARAALETFCRDYWYPLYAYVRRQGYAPSDAQDLTQEFFARLLEKKWVAEADPARGKLRSYLLAALKHFLANEWHQSRRLKRGGGREVVALDAASAEERYALEPLDLATPDRLYDRRWALTLLARTQDRLREEMMAAGQGERFEALEPTLVGERTVIPYHELGERFGVTETAIKSSVLRLRRRFRALLREEVGQTLGNIEEIDGELASLFAALTN